MPEFIPGLTLSRLLYEEAVRPILEAAFPDLPYSASLLGRGSEVLGFDSEMSMDHDWGPRLMLFLHDEDHGRWQENIEWVLRQKLPHHFRSYSIEIPVSPTWTPDPQDSTQNAPQAADGPRVHQAVGIVPLRGFFEEYLDIDISGEIEPVDWLTFPEEKLCAITAGAVYHDGIGLQSVRDRFAYYPHDVWLYRLASGWWRIHPETNIVGRTGFAGDDLGSVLIASRLVRDLMRLCFLMERKYAPYSKWFGSAFAQLGCAATLSPILWKVLRAETWQERELALQDAYQTVADMHNALKITEPVPVQPHHMHNRPFQVLWGDFPSTLRKQIQDPEMKRIAQLPRIGGIEQFTDSVFLLLNPRYRWSLRRLYE